VLCVSEFINYLAIVYAETKKIALLLIVCALWKLSAGQTRTIAGTIEDSLSHAPVSNASVTIQNSRRGVLTNAEGKFRITVGRSVQMLVVTAAGYQRLPVPIDDSVPQSLVLPLSKSYTTLKGVVVLAKPGKYRNKNNPAVELIRHVIANKEKNAPGRDDYTAYGQYEKLRVFLDRPPKVLVNNIILKKYHFLFENKDSTIVPGKTLIPVYIEEAYSQNYDRRHPRAHKKVITGRKSVDFGEFVDMRGISGLLTRLYEDVDIYDNTITVFTTQFISPIAEVAPTFYMYFIRDTVVVNGERLVELYYTPRNPEDLLFRGTMFITLDGNYAVKKAEMVVSAHINLNYVRDFKVKQEFEKGPGGHYWLASSDMTAGLTPFPKSPGLLGERLITVKRIDVAPLPDSVFNGPAIDTLRQASHQTDSFWAQGRAAPLTEPEARTYANTDSLLKMKSYHRLMDYATAFTAGYKSVGKIDVGPIGSFYTFNPVEGQRLKLGGRTTTRLNTRWYGESYVAYGTNDERWKYFASATYAFNNKSIYTFPFHYVQLSYLDDARTLGQENAFAVANNFFTSFSHGDNSKWLYNRIVRGTYIHEYANHFSFTIGMKYWQQQPTGSLQYIYKDYTDQADTVHQLTTSEVNASIRWAPHEQFIQNKAGRSDIVNQYPIITLQYARGIQGLFGGGFNYDAVHLNIYKRVYIIPIGFSDVTLDAGWLGGNLPFPLLIIHPGNPTYFYSETAYNMMNVGEFVSDHYAGVDIDHFFNGFFFNKIPGLKRLRLREVVAGKILYGGLRNENNPVLNPNQMRFPLTDGTTSTYSLGSQPYIEGSVGIYNIFTIFRIDLVKRFTYLNHPNVSSLGLRISSAFNF
jgi:hypothetical protein